MDHWISSFREDLSKMIAKVDLFLLNDSEAMLLSGKRSAVSAGREILKMGPKAVIVKKGEHGALLFADDEIYIAPAYPTDKAVDPTGAGDSFAGALLGRIVSNGFDPHNLIKELFYASAVASICVEDFGPYRLARAGNQEIEDRVLSFKKSLGC